MTGLLNAAAGRCRVTIHGDDLSLPGTLAWPVQPSGVILFAPEGMQPMPVADRDRLARELRRAGLATLMVDRPVHTNAGKQRPPKFDERVEHLLAGIDWAATFPQTAGLPIGVMGVGSGAAVALAAVAQTGVPIAAVVAFAGRPDVVGEPLARIGVPTMLLADGRNSTGLAPAGRAYACLTCTRRLVAIPRPGHVREEDALIEVAQWAAQWFTRHLVMEPAWQGQAPRVRALPLSGFEERRALTAPALLVAN